MCKELFLDLTGYKRKRHERQLDKKRTGYQPGQQKYSDQKSFCTIALFTHRQHTLQSNRQRHQQRPEV